MIHPAVAHLQRVSRSQPGAWKAADALRAGSTGAWPTEVYLPLEQAARAVIAACRATGRVSPKHPSELVQPAAELAGLAAWRVTRGIYRFDPDLYAALLASPPSGALPTELLRHLPAWCVYLETPGLDTRLASGATTPVHGVFAWLDHRADQDRDLLMLGLATDHLPERLTIAPLPLVGSLDNALEQVRSDWRAAIEQGNAEGYSQRGYADAGRDLFPKILSLLLYLCSDQADYPRSERPRAKRTKQGWRLFPAKAPMTWEVGLRIGAALRRHAETASHAPVTANEPGTHARPRPHIRAAHWHLYWTGPRSGPQTPLVRWIPPTGINLDLGETVPVVRPV
jgi:hypothetical protein